MRKNMQANEFPEVAKSRQSALQIASWKHFLGFLLIGAGIVALGMLAQHAPANGGAGTSSGQMAGHSQAIHIYLAAIVMDWLLLYYCWVGVHHGGGSLKTLSGGRWESWKDLLTDVAIAVPFFVIWEGAAYGVHRLLWAFGPSSAKTVDNLLPQSLVEILIWIATSITAGICEEIAFRGYVQKQFHALSGNLAIAVLAQGLVFGLFHAYQGWKNVIVISVLGVLYGMLAAWRGNLRANIIVHAWTDVWEGWLKFVVWR
jgi:membrane protease YdiL (CAAX protease family)